MPAGVDQTIYNPGTTRYHDRRPDEGQRDARLLTLPFGTFPVHRVSPS